MQGFRDWLTDNAYQAELKELGLEDLSEFDYGADCRAEKLPTGDAFRLGKGQCAAHLFPAVPDRFKRRLQSMVAGGIKPTSRPPNRHLAAHLDGHSQAFAGGCHVTDPNWQDRPPVRLSTEKRIFVTMRTCPGDDEASLVMHPVDWEDTAESLDLILKRASFFGGAAITARLLQPVWPVVPEAYAVAFETGDYSNLVQMTPIPIAADGRLGLPPLNPWGVVVFEKAR